jgi:hypothetical protein
MKTIIGLLAFFFLISGILAVNVYSGDTLTIDYSNYFDKVTSYEITNNQSNLDGLNVTIFENKINLTFELGYYPDTFNLIAYGDGTPKETIIEYRSGGGGGGSVRYVNNTINNTIYLPKEIIKEVNVTQPCDIEEIEVKLSLWQRFLNWLRNLF